MLKKSASGVLASLRDSTLRGTPRTLKGLIRSLRFIARANGYTKCGPYLLASSLAVALPDGLFEHPAWRTLGIPDVRTSEIQVCPQSFSVAYVGWYEE